MFQVQRYIRVIISIVILNSFEKYNWFTIFFLYVSLFCFRYCVMISARSRGHTSHPAIGNKTMNSQNQSCRQGFLANPSRTNRKCSRNKFDPKSDIASIYSMVFRDDCKNEFHRLLKCFMGLAPGT